MIAIKFVVQILPAESKNMRVTLGRVCVGSVDVEQSVTGSRRFQPKDITFAFAGNEYAFGTDAQTFERKSSPTRSLAGVMRGRGVSTESRNPVLTTSLIINAPG